VGLTSAAVAAGVAATRADFGVVASRSGSVLTTGSDFLFLWSPSPSRWQVCFSCFSHGAHPYTWYIDYTFYERLEDFQERTRRSKHSGIEDQKEASVSFGNPLLSPDLHVVSSFRPLCFFLIYPWSSPFCLHLYAWGKYQILLVTIFIYIYPDARIALGRLSKSSYLE
jgi:hypothetical protein